MRAQPIIPTQRRRRLPTIALLLLLLAQIGLLAHRIEHYVAADTVSCDIGTCAAFAPTIDPPEAPSVASRPQAIFFAVQFWTAHRAFIAQIADRIGFRAQAPPAAV